METKYENKERITIKTLYDRVEFKGEIYAWFGGGHKRLFVGKFTSLEELQKDGNPHGFPQWFNAIFYNILSEDYMDYKKKMNLSHRLFTRLSVPELNLYYDTFYLGSNDILLIEKNFTTKKWEIIEGCPLGDTNKPFDRNRAIEWLINRNLIKSISNNLN